MAGPVYATRADLYAFGMPRGALANPGLLVGEVSVSADSFELDGHGLVADEEVVFRVEAGGSLPAPLVAGTTYYAVPLSDSTFKVAASAGGAAIDLTSGGENIVVTVPLPVDRVLELYSRWVDDVCIAHGVPFEDPYPIQVVSAVAVLAAARLMWISGQRSITLQELELAQKAQLDRWTKGVPLREKPNVDAVPRTNLAITAVVATVPRSWVPCGDEDTIP